jgi:hypothetical protein
VATNLPKLTESSVGAASGERNPRTPEPSNPRTIEPENLNPRTNEPGTGNLEPGTRIVRCVTYPVTPAPYTGFMTHDPRPAENDWVVFPGGELEGKQPKAMCPACRDAQQRGGAQRLNGQSLERASGTRLLCFQCYRADLERDRAIRAAAVLNTASEERFQAQLPFESVDKPRLSMLKAAHRQAKAVAGTRPAAFAERRHRAQMAARRALQSVISRAGAGKNAPLSDDRARVIAAALRAAELQLPESWIPFVVAR